MNTATDVSRGIEDLRESLGSDLTIAAHYYVSHEVKRWADEIGDSLQLARLAAEDSSAHHLVFCGVLFMGETAAILSGTQRNVYLPRADAGCPLADSATIDGVLSAWDGLDHRDRFLPITYVNSSAEIKAFCGERGGATCTSSSARQVFEAVEESGKRVFFMPDENLGHNTAVEMGIPEEEISRFNPDTLEFEGAGPGDARILLWGGSCPVHVEFSPEDVRAARNRGLRVAAHPECRRQVCAVSDEVGSTDHMVDVVSAGRNESWAIGSEINLVDYLQRQNPRRHIESLGAARACEDMHRITAMDLLATLEAIASGDAVPVRVPTAIAEPARIALDRMLSIVEGRGLTP